MGERPELDGVGEGVGALVDLPGTREETGQAGESRDMLATVLSLVMVRPAWCRYWL